MIDSTLDFIKADLYMHLLDYWNNISIIGNCIYLLFDTRDNAFIPKDMWPMKYERNRSQPAPGPRPVSYNIRNPSPSTVRCAQVPGVGVTI